MSKKISSKKGHTKNSSRSSSKKSSKKKVSFEEDEDELEPLELDEDTLREIEEKDIIEKEIKGYKKSDVVEVNDEVIDNIENKSLNEEAKKKKNPASTVKKTKKQTTIDSILQVYDKLSIPDVDRLDAAQLRVTKLNILERKLTDLTEKLQRTIVTKVMDDPAGKKSSMSDSVAIDALVRINIVMAAFVENIAAAGMKNEVVKAYIPDVTGLTKKIIDPQKDKELRECLKMLMEQHGETIKQYLSPIGMYLFFVTSVTGEVIAENKLKNSPDPTIDIKSS